MSLSIESLPKDCIYHCLSYLTLSEIASAARVCKLWLQCIQERVLPVYMQELWGKEICHTPFFRENEPKIWARTLLNWYRGRVIKMSFSENVSVPQELLNRSLKSVLGVNKLHNSSLSFEIENTQISVRNKNTHADIGVFVKEDRGWVCGTVLRGNALAICYNEYFELWEWSKNTLNLIHLHPFDHACFDPHATVLSWIGRYIISAKQCYFYMVDTEDNYKNYTFSLFDPEKQFFINTNLSLPYGVSSQCYDIGFHKIAALLINPAQSSLWCVVWEWEAESPFILGEIAAERKEKKSPQYLRLYHNFLTLAYRSGGISYLGLVDLERKTLLFEEVCSHEIHSIDVEPTAITVYSEEGQQTVFSFYE